MPHKILTIAGSDSLAGGGIQADLATFTEYGYFGLSVITSIVTVTADDFKIFPISNDVIESQLKSILALDDIVAIKVGLLPNVHVIELVAKYLKAVDIPVIVDPVMVFKETTNVDTQQIADALKKYLIPLATVVTPNINEAQILTHQVIQNIDDMKLAAQKIVDLGANHVVVKGGIAITGNQAIDVLYDGQKFDIFQQDKIVSDHLYNNGAGCTFAASIAANLGQAQVIEEAVADAKDFVWHGIKHGIILNKAFHVGNVWQGARRSV
ncbi:bifunctional hydroxymethylpyrimidine kinase/phosphomethylpyrimidine kinase [Leuconostoc carnosum]|uniref:bifunctional hydroxymethylpyrimidine kinase/phosphomethylpyrimidine kinase n=1 Tax=Leuconostoc TaxID=1243 RepID=UPI000D520AFC|nr:MULTISPECIES: bifunctional hydroxymethylpyrimidine kinase/phosphomethylpyrimidine kinase [Leuconostoc]KAA8325269.1 bifunctional hydroxymethylpyrimidine kinase/phosphomethylpyrimidine kinase [Leuconostoc carnosum]KAA8362535.1 bifunctional hydroxymethylpyrimidine kinase/phosphomethylpyrimidine kinase [Leuconostoc carnosum]KAA8367083.1 bifunctional hydroxymethylpyrimidine kinase/phosphomethylpyrimidine kinase [Leuconostoc carnosum]KAA8367341.1 bifunctional hydroxymethylpyrimidine kinase/phospho